MEPKWVAVLAGNPLFEAIEPEGLRGMMACLKPRTGEFAKNEYITMAGDDFDGIGIILYGSAVVV